MKVVVVGGGAAGMMCAYQAALNDNEVTLIEKNEKLGKKLYITGKGRCNVTNFSDLETVFANINRNSKFLYSAIYGFDNTAVWNFFEENGCKLKEERGKRVFPVSDHSSDVIKALANALKKVNVKVLLNTKVTKVNADEEKVVAVTLDGGKKILCDKVVIATGGVSYPSTGSTGDGYRFAEELGHSIEKPRPSLVPLTTSLEWVKSLQGVSLKNVTLTMCAGGKKVFSELGEMLFTHFGISGPLVLSASSLYDKYKGKDVKVYLDLKPGLSFEQLDKRILRDFDEQKNKCVKNACDKLLLQRMIIPVLNAAGIDGEKKVNEITRAERECLVNMIKKLEIVIDGTRPIDEAIITRGGVNVKEINSSTMESKIIKNLYFAGEVLDVDAMTGGYNLQIAWSTGYLSGTN